MAKVTTRRTTITLSDGRLLHYFDESDTIRTIQEPRGLPSAAASSQLRWDPVTEQWVVIATHRQERTHLPAPDECPLCPSQVGKPTEIPSDDYDVVVFQNRFPSLSPHASEMDPVDPQPGVRAGVGACEVVAFTSDHDASFSRLTPARVRTVVDAWVDRTVELGRSPDTEQVFVFENRGEEIGVTLPHPHGQIYAYPFVPPHLARMLDAARRHRDREGDCLFCRVRDDERDAGVRVVSENAAWTAFVPHAARWPYEVHLYARRHVPDLPALDPTERTLLADIYLAVLRGFDRLFNTPAPYIAAWIQAPTHRDRDLAHLHAQVFTSRRAAGKLKFLAGSESGAGAFINDVAPETAAARLRGEQTTDRVTASS